MGEYRAERAWVGAGRARINSSQEGFSDHHDGQSSLGYLCMPRPCPLLDILTTGPRPIISLRRAAPCVCIGGLETSSRIVCRLGKLRHGAWTRHCCMGAWVAILRRSPSRVLGVMMRASLVPNCPGEFESNMDAESWGRCVASRCAGLRRQVVRG